MVRGIRGAITVDENTKEEISQRTVELLQAIIEKNKVNKEDIVSVIFTVTEDIDAEFPAVAARRLGWDDVPLLCAREIPVPGSMKKCIRVLLHINTDKKLGEIFHIYLRDAKKLRPDLAGE